ncbi:tetratricopeptide repeat protein [Variovorax sp. J31P179]|uniref:tetratricopeptide repeat protein n=1 Tax=Variovorax sp. J31P179 TaxID=3053508 RepID=UPI0025773E9F|nr:tetratricopeptide repeat protein [Variovorax sp. J31P179]MDM0079379.1 tetratricopeptide repeat protein [Variovorax sp. J31P179]
MSRAPARAAVVVCVVAAGLLAACSTPPVRSTAQIRAQGFNTQGMDRYKAGDLPHALTYFEQALQLAQSIEDDDAIAVARLNLSMVYLGMGRQDEALKQLDGVLDEPRLAFSNDRRAEAALRRAMAVQAGDRAGAAQALDRADALCGSRCAVRGKILNLKAYLALTSGRPEEGLRFAQQAHGALAKDDALERANALRLQGSACIALKTPAAAVAPLEEALKLDKAAGASEKIYQDLLLLGQASADRPELARDYWSRAHDVALAADNKAGAERTAKLLASAPR